MSKKWIMRDLVRLAFCEYYGIGPARADLLLALFERNGEPLRDRPYELGRAIDAHRRPTMAAMHESIRILRGCMVSEAIDRDERGYFLSEVGLEDCRAALRATSGALMGVGCAPVAERMPLSRRLAAQ